MGRKVLVKEVEDEPRVVSYAVDWRASYERFRSHRLHFSSTVFFSAFPREKPLPTTMNHRPTSPLLISRRLSAASLSRLFRSPDRKRRNDRIFRTNIYKPCIHHVGTRFSIEPSLHPRTSPSFFSNIEAPHQSIFHPPNNLPLSITRKDPSIHLPRSHPFIVKKLTIYYYPPLLIISHASSRSTSSRSPSHPQLNERSTLLHFAVPIFVPIGTSKNHLLFLVSLYQRSTPRSVKGICREEKERITRPGSTGTKPSAPHGSRPGAAPVQRDESLHLLLRATSAEPAGVARERGGVRNHGDENQRPVFARRPGPAPRMCTGSARCAAQGKRVRVSRL